MRIMPGDRFRSGPIEIVVVRDEGSEIVYRRVTPDAGPLVWLSYEDFRRWAQGLDVTWVGPTRTLPQAMSELLA